jgi:hypothetical protein
MFGHVLRLDENSPAFSSLKFALTNNLKSRKGRHQSNLFNLLTSDLKSRDMHLKNLTDLVKLRDIAFNRAEWRGLF